MGPVLLAVTVACQAQPRVIIHTKNGRDIGYVVEIADTPGKRELGLQYRRELADNRGMLFLFPAEKENVFWMKNTPIPLDMVFIDASHQIVGIVENAVPFSTEARSVSVPSQFVLEIKGGLSRRYGFGVGDRVRFEDVATETAQ
jgi:uncharacterized membrane protein (UPF0127 family)